MFGVSAVEIKCKSGSVVRRPGYSWGTLSHSQEKTVSELPGTPDSGNTDYWRPHGLVGQRLPPSGLAQKLGGGSAPRDEQTRASLSGRREPLPETSWRRQSLTWPGAVQPPGILSQEPGAQVAVAVHLALAFEDLRAETAGV